MGVGGPGAGGPCDTRSRPPEGGAAASDPGGPPACTPAPSRSTPCMWMAPNACLVLPERERPAPRQLRMDPPVASVWD